MDRTEEFPNGTILLEFEGKIARLILNRPEKLNAINDDLTRDVQKALDILAIDEETSVVIVKGAGRAFCSGADMTPSPPLPGEAPRGPRTNYQTWRWLRWMHGTWMRFMDLPQVFIAQIHGYCLAAGIMPGMYSDLVVAADDAEIGMPEARLQGITSEIGFFPETVGMRRAKELLFTGYTVTGKRAEDWGMINKSVPAEKLEEYTEWLAGVVSSTPLPLLSYYKSVVNRHFESAGLRASIWSGIDGQTMISASGASAGFGEIAREKGLKEALQWRDAPFGGQKYPQFEWESSDTSE